MKLLVLGGSFDPVHIGHLFLAEEVRCQFGYDRVVFVPAAEAPHKQPTGETTDRQRLEMLELAVKGNKHFLVDDCEIVRGGRSYTVETIPEINERYAPDGRMGLIIGDDLVSGFSSWRSHEQLAGMVEIIVAHRKFEERIEFEFPHRYADNLLLPISSSDIRRRIAARRAVQHIVPDPVFGYIERYELYRQRD